VEPRKLDAERAEGDDICAEGDDICAEGDDICAEGDDICAEGDDPQGARKPVQGENLFAFTLT